MRVDSIHVNVEHALLFGFLVGGMSHFPVRRNVQLRVIPYYGFPASELGVEQMLCGSLYQKKMETQTCGRPIHGCSILCLCPCRDGIMDEDDGNFATMTVVTSKQNFLGRCLCLPRPNPWDRARVAPNDANVGRPRRQGHSFQL